MANGIGTKITYGDFTITLTSEPVKTIEGRYEWQADGTTNQGEQSVLVFWAEPVTNWSHPAAIQPL